MRCLWSYKLLRVIHAAWNRWRWETEGPDRGELCQYLQDEPDLDVAIYKKPVCLSLERLQYVSKIYQ